jgi:beta-lactamase superfamily II metal-dependent hydrolase
VGRNNVYHHPSPQVVARLADHGARLLRTDRDGMVLVTFRQRRRLRIELPGSPR